MESDPLKTRCLNSGKIICPAEGNEIVRQILGVTEPRYNGISENVAAWTARFAFVSLSSEQQYRWSGPEFARTLTLLLRAKTEEGVEDFAGGLDAKDW